VRGRGAESMSLERYDALQPVSDSWGPDEHVAVVVATGTIVTGESGSMFPLGRTMGSESIRDAVEAAASVPGVRALVIRIDSGGGDALASDEMHHAISNIMRRMPVVVSMGAVAASGGYYMACGADRIFADRLTITGSIGIISGKIVFGGLMDSLGVNIESVQAAPMANMYSTFRPFTETERERAFDLMRDGYEIFVNRVAEGRGMSFEAVDSVGQGRVWSGADALGIGLIDEWGGIADAVVYAAGTAGMDVDAVPEVVVYPMPSFPGSLSLPGAGITSGLWEMLSGELFLFLAPPLEVD
jgi:protease IV